MTKKRVHITVYGRVQNVFFRLGTQKQAGILNLAGWVKNNPDKTVEIIAEGEESDLRKLIDYCRKGPLLSRVDDLDISWEESKEEFEGFSIRY